MLVDDHTMVRKGLRALIESVPGWEVSAEAEDGHQALAIAKSTQPDIVVMDLSMPRLGGIDATIQLRKLLPTVEVLILTMHESEHLIDQAFRAGALGYLLKGDSADSLLEALQALSRHQPYYSLGRSQRFNSCLQTPKSADTRKLLTPRERQVVKLVAEGNTTKAIARILGIGIKTVRTHRASAMWKIGAHSSADLTRYAARNNLVESQF